MECFALGTGGMMPMPTRFTTSVLVRRDGGMMMFDAGEGIQIALKRGALGIRALDAVAVSHMHADHVLGLPGIMMFRAQNEDPGPLTIIGPPGIRRFIEHTLADLRYQITFDLEFVEWSREAGQTAWSWRGASLEWAPLQHSAFCLGYRLVEPQRPGKFNPERACELGVPAGELFGKLQAGESIVTPEGKTVAPEQVMGPKRRGRVFAFATDTRPCRGLSETIRGADIAFVEGMFAARHRDEAVQKGHMTAEEAAKSAADAEVDRLILVHISPRYTREDEAILESEAKAFFDRAEVAKPLGSYPVPLPD